MNIQIVRAAMLSGIALLTINSSWASKPVEPELTGVVTSGLSGDEVSINGHIYRISRGNMSRADLKYLVVGKQVDLKFDASPADEHSSIIGVALHLTK